MAIAALAGLAWYLGSPLFIRTTLVEEAPLGLEQARRGEPGARPSSSDRVGERGGERPLTAGSPSTPGIVGLGRFSDRDQFHRGSGEAMLARLPDGAVILRFEAFRVTNGPDLHVLLSRTEHPTSHDEVYNGVYVGKLKAPEGAFHYELPGTRIFAACGRLLSIASRFG